MEAFASITLRDGVFLKGLIEYVINPCPSVPFSGFGGKNPSLGFAGIWPKRTCILLYPKAKESSFKCRLYTLILKQS